MDKIIQKLQEALGVDCWGADVTYPRDSHLSEVRNRETQLGYWEWVIHQYEGDEGNIPGSTYTVLGTQTGRFEATGEPNVTEIRKGKRIFPVEFTEDMLNSLEALLSLMSQDEDLIDLINEIMCSSNRTSDMSGWEDWQSVDSIPKEVLETFQEETNHYYLDAHRLYQTFGPIFYQRDLLRKQDT